MLFQLQYGGSDNYRERYRLTPPRPTSHIHQTHNAEVCTSGEKAEQQRKNEPFKQVGMFALELTFLRLELGGVRAKGANERALVCSYIWAIASVK